MKYNIKLFLGLLFFNIYFSTLLSAVSIMPLSDVKKGMKGISKTVFYGEKQEKFQVEILDIIHNVSPQTDMILARFTGKNIQKSGVAQGMSGSPVYIDGKLIGAIAFTWPNLKEAIGGIQPIEEMLPVMKESHKKISLNAPYPLQINPSAVPLKKMKNLSLENLEVPITISGLDDQGFNFIKSRMEKKGIQFVKGTGGGSKKEPQKPKTVKNKKDLIQQKSPKNKGLKAGDAVGILLMKGDASANAIGTITYVDDKDPRKVLMFGHPFQSSGYVKYPMTRASIHYVMPSTKLAWKFGSTTDIVGTIYNDRQTAVAGKIGKAPKMIPVTIDVTNNNDNDKHHFSYEIVKHPEFFPNLLSGVIVSSYNRYNSTHAQTAYINLDVSIRNNKTKKIDHFIVKDFVTGRNSQTMTGFAKYISQSLEGIYYNFYDDVDIVNAKASITYEDNIQLAEIVRIITPQNYVEPGQDALLKVVVNTYKNKKEIITIKIPIPIGFKQPLLTVSLAGGKIEEQNTNKTYKGLKDIHNYYQLMEALKVNNNAKDIVAFYDIKGISANIDGFKLENLPLSKAISYGIKSQGNKYFAATRKRFRFKTNYIIIGQLQTMISIKQN